MKSHFDLAARCDLRERVASLPHYGRRAGLEVVCSAREGLADGVFRFSLKARCVLLKRLPSCPVPGSRGVDAEGHARATCVAHGLDDGGVAGDLVGQQREDESRGQLHDYGVEKVIVEKGDEGLLAKSGKGPGIIVNKEVRSEAKAGPAAWSELKAVVIAAV